jgi:hypothetical protein
MKWRKWSIVTGQHDFLPIMIGVILLFISLPTFVLLLVNPDRNSGVIGLPLLVWLAIGIIIGASFVIVGIRVCSTPGSLMYRLSHGRIFWH